MRKRSNAGFTLIEVIVVAAIIAILAGILVPLIFNQIDESKITRATADCKSMQTAILSFKKDTGAWPDKVDATTVGITQLYSEGTRIPDADLTALGWDLGSPASILMHMKIDDNAAYGPKWKGPYMSSFDADPWGNTYVINASTFKTANVATWVISAGPNGKLETGIDTATGVFSEVLVNDDIGVRIK